MQNILPYKNLFPSIAPDAFIAPNAMIIGDVHIGSQAGIWFGCVVRGDVAPVKIGARTNIQDGTVIHTSRYEGPTIIGSGVTVGHKAILHACTLEDDCFVGMGSILMDKVVVERGGMVAAGALVTPGKRVKAGQIWAGNPAKYFRDMTDAEKAYIAESAANYVTHVEEYLNG